MGTYFLRIVKRIPSQTQLKYFTWPPLFPYFFRWPPPLKGRFFSVTPLPNPTSPPSLLKNERSLSLLTFIYTGLHHWYNMGPVCYREKIATPSTPCPTLCETCAFLYIPQSYENWRVVRRGFPFIILIWEDLSLILYRMSVQRQHFLLSYLKTLSVDPAKVFQPPTSYTAGLQITADQRTMSGQK